jgi:hypothetical protein
MRAFSSLWLALILCCAAPALIAQRPSGGAPDPQAQFKAEVAFHLGLLKEALGGIDEETDDLIELVTSAALSGQVPYEDFLEQLTELAIDALTAGYEEADDEVRLIEQFTSGAVGGQGAPPEALMPGSCAEIEKFQKKLAGMLAKADAALLKDVKKAIATVDKALDARTNVVLAPTTVPDPPAPGPGSAPQPSAPKKPVKIQALMAGSDVTVADDGRLCVGGTAEPTLNSGNVVITITGPNSTVSTTAVIDPLTCRWRACFENLREGNYAVVAHQGGATATARIGVPGAPR